MAKDALVTELRAAAARLVTATAAAENRDWAAAEQLVVEVQDRSGRILREIELTQSSAGTDHASLPQEPPLAIKGD